MNYNISTSSFQGYGFLNNVNNARAKSMEKLSSGYRINYASDDSAGSSMSSIMRSQIRGLQQATRNSDDAIALLDCADSGLAEISSILQRIRELGVQSVNDTNTPEDRLAMQDETEQLLAEIDRIAKTTEYNTIKLLNNTPEEGGQGRGLAVLVGAGNITPDGNLSETLQTWQILDTATHGANATDRVYRTTAETHKVPTAYENITTYNDFQNANGNYYTGDIYDSAGNKLGTVPNTTGTAVLDASASTILPENAVPYPTLPSATSSATDSYTYTTPSTTPATTYTEEKSKIVTGTVPASSSSVYGKDTAGNLIPLSYTTNSVDRVTGDTYIVYKDFDEPLAGVSINFTKYNTPNGFTNADLYGTGFNSTCATCDNHYSIKFVQGTTSQIQAYGQNHTLEIGVDVLPANATGADLAKLVVDTVKNYTSDPIGNHFTQYAALNSTLYVFDRRGLDYLNNLSSRSDTYASISYEDTLIKAETYTPMKIQAGANSYEVINIALPYISTQELGIQDVDLREGTLASEAITALDSAIQYISKEREKLGTFHTRLEHVSNVTDSSALSATESESKIHDVDYSREVLEFSKAQVLETYGVNSVVEINKMIENVLEFIK